MKISKKLPQKLSVLIVALAALGFTAACEKKGEGSENPDDAAEGDADADPVAKLEQYQADIQAEMDKAMAPITETEALINAIGEAPAKMNVDKATLMGMFKASFENGTVEVSADLEIEAEARAELEALLQQAADLKATFETYPEDLKAIAGNLTELSAKAMTDATATMTALSTKLKNPLMKADAKAEVQGQLETVTSIKADLEGKVQEIKAMPQELPAKAAEASAKFTATLAAG